MKGSLSAGRACSVGKRGGASVGSGAWPCRGVAKAALRAPGWCAPRGRRRRLCPARQCGCGAALASCSSPLLGPTCPAGRRLASKNTATGAAAAAAATSPWNRRRRRCREGRPRSGPAGDRGAGSERPSRVPHRTQSQPSTLLHLLHPHLTLIPWPPVGVRPHPAFPAACRASLPASPRPDPARSPPLTPLPALRIAPAAPTAASPFPAHRGALGPSSAATPTPTGAPSGCSPSIPAQDPHCAGREGVRRTGREGRGLPLVFVPPGSDPSVGGGGVPGQGARKRQEQAQGQG